MSSKPSPGHGADPAQSAPTDPAVDLAHRALPFVTESPPPPALPRRARRIRWQDVLTVLVLAIAGGAGIWAAQGSSDELLPAATLPDEPVESAMPPPPAPIDPSTRPRLPSPPPVDACSDARRALNLCGPVAP
jgi:hypothetical protein